MGQHVFGRGQQDFLKTSRLYQRQPTRLIKAVGRVGETLQPTYSAPEGLAASLRGHFSWVRRQRRVTVPKVDGAGELTNIRVYSIHTEFYALAKNSFVPR